MNDAIAKCLITVNCFCSSDEISDSSNTDSSIVFQSFSEAPTNAAPTTKASPADTKSVKALVPAQEKGQVVCPKTMRRLPENYVPCVFLGQRGPMKSSICPAMGWDSSAVLEEESSRSSIELNNNSCIDKERQQWAVKCTTKPSKEVCASRG